MGDREASTIMNCGAEDIGIFAIVVSELKLSHVQMQILFADLVKRADDTALQDRPKTLDGLRMNRAVNVLVRSMVNDAMRIPLLGEAIVARPVIGAEQANLMRDGFVDERAQRRTFDVLNNAGDHIAFATNCADDNGFSLPLVALSAPLIPVPVTAVAADDRLVNLNDPAKLLHVLDQCGSDLVAHEPSRFVRTEAHIAKDLKSAHPLLRHQHEMRDSEPILEGLIRIFKNCPGKIRETIASIAARSALRALPMPSPGVQFIDGGVATARAKDALRPTASDQIRFAVVLSLKQRIELRCGHLMDGLRLLLTGHGNHPRSMGGLSHV